MGFLLEDWSCTKPTIHSELTSEEVRQDGVLRRRLLFSQQLSFGGLGKPGRGFHNVFGDQWCHWMQATRAWDLGGGKSTITKARFASLRLGDQVLYTLALGGLVLSF